MKEEINKILQEMYSKSFNILYNTYPDSYHSILIHMTRYS